MTLYYDDPLAAAIMARDFGVRLLTTSGKTVKMTIFGNSIAHHCPPFYIHPDSLPIFAPQMGDIIEDGNGDVQSINYDAEMFVIRYGLNKIIQRDGKPFYWPKEEV